LLVGGREFVRVRQDQLVDQADHATVLLGHGLGMHARYPRRIEVGAHLREQGRDFLHSRSRGTEPIGHRREFARHQRVKRTTGELPIDLRVPSPALQGLGRPEVVAQLVVEQGGVDLIFARELAAIHLAEFGEHALRERKALRAACGAEVIELAVETMVADLRGEHRAQLHRAIEPTLGQVGEGGVCGCF
jgi:hypothetical protein